MEYNDDDDEVDAVLTGRGTSNGEGCRSGGDSCLCRSDDALSCGPTTTAVAEACEEHAVDWEPQVLEDLTIDWELQASDEMTADWESGPEGLEKHKVDSESEPETSEKQTVNCDALLSALLASADCETVTGELAKLTSLHDWLCDAPDPSAVLATGNCIAEVTV